LPFKQRVGGSSPARRTKTLELHKADPFNPADIVNIDADVFQDAYDFMGGGRFGPKKNVHTKEDSDHSIPFLLSVLCRWEIQKSAAH
jgi:2-methylcitrate dehydratase PrpD